MLDKRQRDEMAEHRRGLDREIEAHSHLYEREMEKARLKARSDMDSKVIAVFFRAMCSGPFCCSSDILKLLQQPRSLLCLCLVSLKNVQQSALW